MALEERQPLLPGHHNPAHKPFYRPRPLWLVPFAITAAIVRGMTIAPRVEVLTQLSCTAARHNHHSYNHTAFSVYSPHNSQVDPLSDLGVSQDPANTLITILPLNPPDEQQSNKDKEKEDEEPDPRVLPTNQCLSSPVVQAGAARLQTIMTITMGGLSALTTAWWGQFGERFGRTRVLAIATLGLFLSDLIFILVSTPHSPLATHGHKLLILSPLIEGLLGGWSSLQCATSAYLSDCTSPGSRAQIFSRFTGVLQLGVAFGPSLGAFLIRHPVLGVSPKSVTEVFWVAVACSFVNLLLVLFVFPESLSEEKRSTARDDAPGKGKARAPLEDIGETSAIDDVTDTPVANGRIIDGFLSPLSIFLPVTIDLPRSGRRRRDWSLTFLACALFASMVSLGISQVKYLYAGHVYGWGADKLGYYISFLGGARALNLLVILPFIISTFKPTSVSKKTNLAKSKKMMTKARLAREIDFDIRLAWYSLLIDFASHLLVFLSPPPSIGHKPTGTGFSLARTTDFESQSKFVLFSALSSMGSGSVPAIQSLAICLSQARAVSQEGDDHRTIESDDVDTGQLFGALAVLQAVGQTILGPVLFGVMYSETVVAYPKAIFVTAACILLSAMTMISLARPAGVSAKGKRRMKRWEREEAERGRSRARKDLRGGSASYVHAHDHDANVVHAGPSTS